MGRLTNKEFLTQVESFLNTNNGKSSVYLTQKRLNPIETQISTSTDISSKFEINDPLNGSKDDSEYPLLLRFTNGKKELKLSTVVEFKYLNNFWSDYANILKVGFVGLKKKSKGKKKKAKKSSKVTK